MKVRKLALSILALALVGGATAGASEAVQYFKGKQVRVEVNGKPIDGGGLQIDGEIYLPVRALTGTLQALIRSDADGLHIDKPNAHLLVLMTRPKNASTPLAGKLNLTTYEFSVLVQVDNMRTNVHSTKVAIFDPAGEVLDEQVVLNESNEIRKEFMYITNPFKIHFRSAGDYKVRFYIKQSKDSDYELISEKAIVAEKE